MVFVHPLFLWALAAVAAPVIIHLFNFRRYTKVYFTNVKFLRELRQESKSKSRLRELLVLLARCLAIACLVMAFSQPVVQKGTTDFKPGNSAVGLYIDNSFSMQNVNRQGPLLQIAKTRAREVINSFGSADKFQVMTNDFEGRHQRFYSKDDALHVIDEIQPSASVRLFSDVLRRQADFLKSATVANRRMYAFTDAQRTTFNLPAIEPDTTIRLTLVPLTANRVNNVLTDTCWFETPLQQKGFIQKLHARITNNSGADVEAGTARLFLNSSQVAISSFSLGANLSTEIVFTFECRESGFNYGSVRVEDYPVTFDDELFFAFTSSVNIPICVVNGSEADGKPMESLFLTDSLFTLKVYGENTVDYNSFRNSEVLILNQLQDISSGMLSELIRFTSQGGALVVIPAATPSPAFNSQLSALGLPELGMPDTAAVKTGSLSFAGGFYAGVFEKSDDRLNLPLVNMHFRLLKNSGADFEPILTLRNGDAFFGFTRVNNARIYLFTSPLGRKYSNFSSHSLFVPTFYQVCFSAVKAVPLFYVVNTNVMINVRNNRSLHDQPPHIIKNDHRTDVIPEMREVNHGLFIYTRNQVREPGFYTLNSMGVNVLPLAFNYSRLESLLESYTAAELQNIIAEKGWKNVAILANTDGDISAQVLQGAEGKKLWKLFIILALVMVAFEVAILRFLK